MKEKLRAGRKPHLVTDDASATVRRMIAGRATHAAIAAALSISVPTLRKCYRADLAERLSEANLFTAAATQTPPRAPAPRRPRKKAAAGRPAFVATLRQRDEVKRLAAMNWRHADIAAVIGISEPTLRDHFADELRFAGLVKRAEALELLERSAKAGKVAAQVKYLAILDEAQAERSFEDPAPAAASPSKPLNLGKKEVAAMAAEDAMAAPEWVELLQPARPN